MPEVKPNDIDSEAKIKVVGVGGAGGHAIDRMREVGLSGVELIAVNTDAQQLRSTKADVKVPLHMDSTKGLGAGADPAKGEKAADESREDIKKALEGADMVFVTFGAGGGTGSGAGYIVAEEARKLGILTVGVVTKPFSIEGKVRKRNADWAIEHMARSVDALITIPNDRLMEVVDVNIPWRESLRIADDVLRQGVQGVSEIITEEHDINLDFADVCAIIKDAGSYGYWSRIWRKPCRNCSSAGYRISTPRSFHRWCSRCSISCIWSRKRFYGRSSGSRCSYYCKR